MKIKTIFEKLLNNEIPFILIGGTALISHGSSRVTLDTDIAIKTIDIDKIIELLYEENLKLVIDTDKEEHPILAENVQKALSFASQSKWGFLKFLSEELELDFIYETPIPFIKLYNGSIEKEIDDIKIKIANLEHLKLMKEKSIETRDDEEKLEIDKIDLNFINKKLNN